MLMAPLKKDQRQGATSTLFCAATTGEVGEVSLSPHDAGAGSELARNEELGEQLVKEKVEEDSVSKGCPLRGLVVG